MSGKKPYKYGAEGSNKSVYVDRSEFPWKSHLQSKVQKKTLGEQLKELGTYV